MPQRGGVGSPADNTTPEPSRFFHGLRQVRPQFQQGVEIASTEPQPPSGRYSLRESSPFTAGEHVLDDFCRRRLTSRNLPLTIVQLHASSAYNRNFVSPQPVRRTVEISLTTRFHFPTQFAGAHEHDRIEATERYRPCAEYLSRTRTVATDHMTYRGRIRDNRTASGYAFYVPLSAPELPPAAVIASGTIDTGTCFRRHARICHCPTSWRSRAYVRS